MSATAAHPRGVRTPPGSPRAKTVTAGAVIITATAVAGAALVAGIAAGSAVEAPAQDPRIVQPAETTSPLTSTASFEQPNG